MLGERWQPEPLAEHLPFPPLPSFASRPPVKVSLRLATLGLDWSCPRCQHLTKRREWQVLHWQEGSTGSRWSPWRPC